MRLQSPPDPVLSHDKSLTLTLAQSLSLALVLVVSVSVSVFESFQHLSKIFRSGIQLEQIQCGPYQYRVIEMD